MAGMIKGKGVVTVERAQPYHRVAIIDLLTREYRKKRYINGEDSSIHYPSLTQSNIIVFVALCDERVIGTIMLEICSLADSPVVDDFSDKVKDLHRKSKVKRIGYIGRLAVDENFRQGRITKMLFKPIGIQCLLHLVDAAVCIVNPKHDSFYTRMGFDLVGSSEKTKGLVNAPASLLVLPLRRWVIMQTVGWLKSKVLSSCRYEWISTRATNWFKPI